MNLTPYITLATAAFPSLEYMQHARMCQSYFIDTSERFIKQSNRNRYHIAGPNGLQTLVIPVKHDQIFDTDTATIKIMYTERWQQQHWRSLTTAYNRSPFFEFYKEELHSLIMRPHQYLHELNEQALHFFCKHFKIKQSLRLQHPHVVYTDLKHISSAKGHNPVTPIALPQYRQLFVAKYPFIQNLSMLDMLFNCGPAK